MLFGRLFVTLACALCLVACTTQTIPQPPPTPVPTSLWGRIYTVAQAETNAAPALMPLPEHAMLIWSGADAAEVRHYAGLPHIGQPQIVTLRAFYPYAQALYPAANDLAHLLYLDRDAESDENRLLAATVNRNLVAELGPNPVSNRPAGHYAAISTTGNNLRVVWSHDDATNPELITQTIDPQGRIRFATPLDVVGTHPALARDSAGNLYLFWLHQRRIWQATLVDDGLEAIRSIGFDLRREPGDSLLSLQAASDPTHLYLFWQIRRADGTPEVWWASSPQAHSTWIAPQRFGLAVAQTETIQTGYNSGRVQAAASGTQFVRWLNTATQGADALPLAIHLADEIGVAYMRAGQIVGYQQIVADVGPLLSAPTIAADATRHLYLAWSQPNANGTSDVRYTATQRGN